MDSKAGSRGFGVKRGRDEVSDDRVKLLFDSSRWLEELEPLVGMEEKKLGVFLDLSLEPKVSVWHLADPVDRDVFKAGDLGFADRRFNLEFQVRRGEGLESGFVSL